MTVFRVNPGEVKEIAARTYQYEEIVVEPGGVLRVRRNSRKWLILSATKSIYLLGRFEFTGFYATRSTLRETTPGGVTIDHKFELSNLGGDGADGHGVQTANGGRGVFGTEEFGGGGGGSGFWRRHDGWVRHGADAVEWRGGSYVNRGGNGGRRARYSNGGLVCLEAAGKIYLGDTLNLNGDAGENGGPSDYTKTRGSARSGAGGGGPGGEGGRLVLLGSVEEEPDHKVEVNGGKGGKGGRGEYGAAGRDGEAGFTGFVDYR